MMNSVQALSFLLVTIFTTHISHGQKIYSWDEAHNHIGETAIVEGRITVTKNIGDIIFLNFHERYQDYVSLVIYSDDFNKFPEAPERYYKNKLIRVKGEIKEYKGRAQIVVKSSAQIRVAGQKKKTETPKSNNSGAVQSASKQKTSERSGSNPEYLEVKWDEAHKYVGRKIRTKGQIVASRNIGKIIFLNFSDNYYDFLSLIIFEENFNKFSNSPEEYFLSKNVEVTGKVTTHKEDRAQIVIESPSQIKVVDEKQSDEKTESE